MGRQQDGHNTMSRFGFGGSTSLLGLVVYSLPNPFFVSDAKMKFCPRCEDKKSIEDFSIDLTSPDGRRYWCRECIAKYGKEWRKKHPKYMRDYNGIYYQKHKESIKKQVREYRESRSEEDRKRQKKYMTQWREVHCEQDRQLHTEWRKKHPDKIAKYRRRRRAKKLGVDECFTAETERFVRSFWGHRCAVCGRGKMSLFENRLHIDHWLPLAPENGGKGYSLAPGNAVLLCRKHNGQKRNYLGSKVFGAQKAREIELRLRDQVNEWNRRKEMV